MSTASTAPSARPMPTSDIPPLPLVVLAAACLLGCHKAKSEAETAYTIRETEIVLLECNAAVASETLDANEDGKPEVYVVQEGGRPKCRRVDLDLDGRTDRTTHYDSSGAVARVESDFDRDGRVDEIALHSLGSVVERHRASSLDGKLDTWEYYQSGQLVRAERDENGDGIVDQWWDYREPACPLVHVDLDADGRPDPSGTLNYCEATGERIRPSKPSPSSPKKQAPAAPPPPQGGPQ